jgi:SAM-dependent methyltransferase
VTDGASTKLNLGAGFQEAPGWINYDRSRMALLARFPVTRRLLGHRVKWSPNTRVHDLSAGVPHADASVDVIYSSHMLEHFTRDDAVRLLAECHRVLRPGGLIRLIVPDLEVVARAYLEGDRTLLGNHGGLIADAFCDGMYGGTRGRERLLRRTAKRVMRSDDGGHKWMYDEESLTRRLADAGFVEIRRVPRGEGRDADAAALDVRGGYHLHMEALKPS